MKSKYKARKTVVEGIVFDSLKEAERFKFLKALERSGQIKDLVLQKEYELIPKQRDENGKTIRKCSYFADFTYFDNRTGNVIVEDVKGMKTEVYKLKSKLMLYRYGVTITEI